MGLITLGRLELAGHEVPHRQALLLLAYLKIEGQKERSFLAELFWPEAKNPLNNLSSTMTRVRSVDPSLLDADRYTVSADLAADLDVFADHAAAGRNGEALDIYGGRFLDGLVLNRLSYELQEWVLDQRAALAATARDCATALAGAMAEAGRREPAIAMAERALALGEDAVPEAATLLALHPILVDGNHPLAASVLADARELGVAPTGPIATSGDTPAPAGSPIGADGEAGRPALVERPFIGRDTEVDQVIASLEQDRAVAITGLGGVGKTQLAVAVLDRLGPRLGPHAWVDGAGASSGDGLPELISQVCLPDQSPAVSPDDLASAIGQAETLLVLDGVDGMADQLDWLGDLVAACPGLSVILTSRGEVTITGLEQLNLGGLPLVARDGRGPGPAAELFRLWFHRRAPVGTTIDGEDPAIAAICRQVDGLPLAIELAAGWLTVLTPAEIADGLASAATAPNLLADVDRAVDPGHAEFETVMAGTWDLLDDQCRTGLSRLSVFPSGFDRAAAEAVGECTLITLRRLASWSLIARPDGRHYRCHPLVRDFARRRLADDGDQEEEARWAHARYLQETIAAAPMVESFEAADVLATVEDPVANLLAVWDLLVEELDVDAMTELVDPLDRVLSRFGRIVTLADVLGETIGRLTAAEGPSTILDRLAMHEVWLDLRLGNYGSAKATADKLLDGDRELQPDIVVEVTRASAAIDRTEGNVDRALDRLRGAVDAADAVSPRMRALIDDDIGLCQMVLGLYEESRESYRSVLAWARAEGSQPVIARTLLSLGIGHYDDGEVLDALAYLLEAKSVVVVNQLAHLEPYVDVKLGLAQVANGDTEPAAKLLAGGRRAEGLEPWLVIEFDLLAARLAGAAGETRTMFDELERALGSAVEINDVPFMAKAYVAMAELIGGLATVDPDRWRPVEHDVVAILAATATSHGGADHGDRQAANTLLDRLVTPPAASAMIDASSGGLADLVERAYTVLRRGRVMANAEPELNR